MSVAVLRLLIFHILMPLTFLAKLLFYYLMPNCVFFKKKVWPPAFSRCLLLEVKTIFFESSPDWLIFYFLLHLADLQRLLCCYFFIIFEIHILQHLFDRNVRNIYYKTLRNLFLCMYIKRKCCNITHITFSVF